MLPPVGRPMVRSHLPPAGSLMRTGLSGVGALSLRVAILEAVKSPSVPRQAIAVLPFQNMSGDPEQEYFADGMVEEIIIALSRIRWLFVIARNSSFSYKGQSPDIKQVGRELGVRYRSRRLGAQGRQPGADHRPADRFGYWHPSVGRPVRRLAGRRLRPSGQGG